MALADGQLQQDGLGVLNLASHPGYCAGLEGCMSWNTVESESSLHSWMMGQATMSITFLDLTVLLIIKLQESFL